MKKTPLILTSILAMFLCASAGVSAHTAGPGCLFAWDWAFDEATIDGFRLYVDTVAVAEIAPDARQITCADAGLVNGAHVAQVSAFNAAGESAKSNDLTFVFVDSPPGAPGDLRLVVSF